MSIEPGDESRPPVPWHFKLMVGLAVVYVGWRLVQMITWLFGWIGNQF